MDSNTPAEPGELHYKIGVLTRQLHDSLNELGLADRLRGSMDELPDAQSRLSYIARLTGEAAEKVLNRVEQAKAQQAYIADETRRMVAALIKDPVAAVAKGDIMNFLTDMEEVTQKADEHLTEIMMAQDFHDLTGQVISRVVALASNLEDQLVQMLIQTAPPGGVPSGTSTSAFAAPAAAAGAAAAVATESLAGPVVEGTRTADVVTSQSQVDDLLASLGF